MKGYYVSDLKKDDEIIDFFMLRSKAVKVGSNGKKYLDVTLSDKTGEITGKKWDLAENEAQDLEELKPVRVKASVTEWNGAKQLRVMKIRHSVESDGLDPADYYKTAPETGSDMFAFVLETAQGLADADLQRLCVKLLTDNRERLLYYPAASKNHHAEMGGLLYHVKRMLMTGQRLCEVYTNLNKDLVLAGVILHDIEKLNEIESDEYGQSPGYSFEGKLLGHIIQGIVLLDKETEALQFPREKAIMLEHMILSHHYEPEFGSPKRPLFPEAEILHYLDMIDARMYDMQEALSSVEPGSFSERIWTLDNRSLYKPKEQA